jgi:hypothetical protein
MESYALDKDSPEVQRDRISRLVSEFDENLRVEFYDNKPYPSRTDIRFRLVDTAKRNGKIVGSIRQDCEWSASEIADKNDSDLLQMIVTLIAK